MKAYLEFDDIFIEIVGNTTEILSILFVKERTDDNFSLDSEVAKARTQLIEYLDGKRFDFDLNLRLETTPFNQKVYEVMQKIPYGQVKSYKDIALEVDNPKAFRAVGNANNKNNFIIVIPCHRVIGSNNKLGGFGPGVRYKKILLQLEQDGGQEWTKIWH